MEYQFEAEHFKLLRTLGGKKRDKSNPAHVTAYELLSQAYFATDEWARRLKERKFPTGWYRSIRKPTDTWNRFLKYNWARIYPWADAPERLAYTVGIDGVGEFCVKIDTKDWGEPLRSDYLTLWESSGDAFTRVLSARNGLRMSLDGLVDWSIEAIDSFEMDYLEVGRRLGMFSRKVRLAGPGDSRRGFVRWVDCLREGTVGTGPVRMVSEHRFVFRAVDDEGRLDVNLGVDATGSNWLAQINEAAPPPDFNVLGGVATDERGRLILVRQGFLRGNRISDEVKPELFIERTGLTPVEMEGEGARRRWFYVADLEASPEHVRSETAAFVRMLEVARGVVSTIGDNDRREGNDEVGGTYRRGPMTFEERLVERRQGNVWLALKQAIEGDGRRVVPVRNSIGHSIDAEIVGLKGKPLLVEIKTDVSSASLQTGIGQLHLYPELIGGLGTHRRILLLPDYPPLRVRQAIERCHVEVHRYHLVEKGELESGAIVFSAEFLDLCEVA